MVYEIHWAGHLEAASSVAAYDLKSLLGGWAWPPMFLRGPGILHPRRWIGSVGVASITSGTCQPGAETMAWWSTCFFHLINNMGVVWFLAFFVLFVFAHGHGSNRSGIGEFTTHFRTYLSGDWMFTGGTGF